MVKSLLQTRLTELLQIQYPIIQGGMAWVADAQLASGVSMAGGLGIIAAANAPVEWVREQIHIVKERTDKPFGVNIMLMSPTAEDVAQLVVEERVPVVTTGAGSPGKYMDMWKGAGITVIPVVASTALAKRMERLGADAVVAEGCEAGGHIGELTTMALLPQVVDSVDIPVVAAGGVGDGRGLLAVYMLGADGVQVGTRFVVAKECSVHENYKQKIVGAKDIDTVVTGRSGGHPIRQLKNPFTRNYLSMEREETDIAKLEEFASGSLRKAVVEGDTKEGSFMAGQIAGLVSKQESCQEIIEDLFGEAQKLLSQWEGK